MRFSRRPTRPTASQPASPGRRRLRATLAAGVLFVTGLIVVALVAALLLLALLQHDGFARWAAQRVADAVNPYPTGRLTFGGASGTWVTGLELTHVRLVIDGDTVLAIDTVRATYDPVGFATGAFAFREVLVAGPAVRVRQLPDSTWDLLRPFARDTTAPESSAPGPSIAIGALSVSRGSLSARFHGRDSALALEAVELRARDLALGAGPPTIRLDSLRVVAHPPSAPGPVELKGRGALHERRLEVARLELQSPRSHLVARGVFPRPGAAADSEAVDFTLEAAPLAYEDFGPFVPGFDGGGELRLELEATGTAAKPVVRLDAQFPRRGSVRLEGEGTSLGAAVLAYRGSLRIRGLDPAQLTGRAADSGRVNADLDIDLTGPAIDSLTGDARLTVAGASTHGVEARDLTLRAQFQRGRARLGLQGAVNAMRLDVRGSARPLDTVPSYDVAGTLDDVSRFIPRALRDRVLRDDGPIEARLEVVGRGVALRSAAGRARLSLETRDTIRSSGLRRADVTTRYADATLTGDAVVTTGFGNLAVPFTVGRDDEVEYRVEGATIRGLDGARLLGIASPSELAGALSLEGRGLDPRSLSASLSLELSGTWGGYDSVSAHLTGSARAGAWRGEATAQLDSSHVLLGASLLPFGPSPALAVERLEVERLDLARLAPDALPATALTASGTLRASGADLARAVERIGRPAPDAPTDVTLDGRIDLRDSRVAGLDLATAAVAFDLADDSLRVEAGFDGSSGTTRLRGIVSPFTRPIAYRVTEARFVRLDVAPLVGGAFPSDLNGHAVLAGQGVSPSRLTVDGVLMLDSSIVRDVTVASAHVSLRAANGLVSLRGRFARPHGLVLLDADATMPDSAERRLELRLALDDTVSVPAEEPVPVSLAITGMLAERPDAGTPGPLAVAVSAKGNAGQVVLDSAHATFQAARGLLAFDTLFIRSAIARVDGAGRVAVGDVAAGASDLEITAEIDDLEPLAPLLGARHLGLDSARLEVRFRGRSDSLAFDATATGQAFAFDDHRLGQLSAAARGWLRGDRSLGALEGSLHAARARVGIVDVRLLQGEVSWSGEEWSTRGSLVIDDRRQLTLAGRLDPEPGSQRVLLESLVLVAGGEPWTLRQPVEARYGDTLAVRGFALVSRDGEITADGVLDGGAEGRLHAELSQIPLAAFSDLLGFPELAGHLDGTIDVAGTARAPRVTGELIAELRARQEPAARVTTKIDWYGRRFGLDLNVVDRGGGTLTLAGTLPRGLSAASSGRPGRNAPPDSLDLRLTTDTVGLRMDVIEPFLDPRAAADIGGRLVADARIAGPAEAPTLSGQLAVRGGRVRVPTLGVVYDSISGRAVLSGDRVRFEALRIVSGGGAVDVTGTLAIARETGGRPFDLAIALSGFTAVATSSYEATLTGEVRLHGVRGAPVLEGTVAVRDAHVNLSTSQATANVERVELTAADLRTLEQRFGYGLSGVRSPLDGLYDALALDLTVQLERNTWLRHPNNPQVVLELVGRVRVRKAPHGELLADGTVELLPGRSYVEQFGTRFEVRSGEVVLAGRPEELHLNVKTRHEAGTRQTRREGGTAEPAVVITLDVEGTPDEISLTLASDPELTDTEIISYLATGRLPDWTPGGGQAEGNVAADIALRQVTRNVQGALGETLPLDVVEIRTDGLRGLTLVAGRYTSPQLYLGVKQPVSFSTDEHTSTTAAKTTEFEVEYEAYQWLLMNLQGGSSALRFFLKTRRDY